jgi:hypothetical protein
VFLDTKTRVNMTTNSSGKNGHIKRVLLVFYARQRQIQAGLLFITIARLKAGPKKKMVVQTRVRVAKSVNVGWRIKGVGE